MAHEAPARSKSPQPARGGAAQSSAGPAKARPHGTRQGPRGRDGRGGYPGGGPVIELECGITGSPTLRPLPNPRADCGQIEHRWRQVNDFHAR